MKILLIDTPARKKLFPLTLTRATCHLRIGITTLKEKWENLSGLPVEVLTEPYLQPLYQLPVGGEYFAIYSDVLPSKDLYNSILLLPADHALVNEGYVVAGRCQLPSPPVFGEVLFSNVATIPFDGLVRRLTMPQQIFKWNSIYLEADFDAIRSTRNYRGKAGDAIITNPENVFIEDGAVLEHCVINASTAPVYIGKDTHIMDGCSIRGPFALCHGAVLKMGTKVYGATTIGPGCVAGGEIKNSVMMGYSNKAHNGYLGDSVLGHWCNLGAGTSNSNVKNNAGTVKVYNYEANDYISAGDKCGLVMGDYSRAAINTSFNTGTVVGICCNVFDTGLTKKFISDFSWGGNGGHRYLLPKCIEDIKQWMKFKNVPINEATIKVLTHIFDATS